MVKSGILKTGLKKVGVLAFLLASGVALLQPSVASAQDRFDRGGCHYDGDRHRAYDNRRDFRYDEREWRGERRDYRDWDRRYDQRYYAAPNYYNRPGYYGSFGFSYSPQYPYPY